MNDGAVKTSADPASHRGRRWLSALVFVVALLPFLRGLNYPFINLDDSQYVFENPHVKGGLTAANVKWALTTGHQANWHPLTWLSLQLDSTLFGGTTAVDYRATNLLLHALNAMLLFWLLSGMTGCVWHSLIASGLFAVHPLRVESVLWVTERKDVLSTFFWLLAMLAYFRYVRKPGVGRYLPVAAALALGLMAKPMLVTLPFALLLLDYWPLRRLEWGQGSRAWWLRIARLSAEKLPLLAIVLASALVTYRVQQAGGSVTPIGKYLLEARLSNAIVSYVMYIWQTVWPDELAPFYPLSLHHLSDWSVILAGAGLLAATIACVRWGRNAPYLPVGWFWFLGTLVPVIGLVQVGVQARADRYTYVPEIGLLILAVWGGDAALDRWSIPVRSRTWLAFLVLAILSALTWVQVGHWRSNLELWEYTFRVTNGDNMIVQQNLGIALLQAERPADALPHLQRGVELDPKRSGPYLNLANCLVRLEREEEAIPPLLTAVRLDPTNTQAIHNLSVLLARAGRDEEALPYYLALNPDDPAAAHRQLARLLMERNKVSKARAHYERAAELDPTRASAHFDVGIALMSEGRPASAERPLREALRLEPTHTQALTNLGLVLWHLGRTDEALACCQRAVVLDPQLANARTNLALVLGTAGRTAEAKAEYAQATQLDRDWRNNAVLFAWTTVVEGKSDQGLFLPRCLARQACEDTNYHEPRAVMALAAVEAAEGRFNPAVDLLIRARADAESARNMPLVAMIDQQLAQYRAGKCLRPEEKPSSP